MIKPKLHSKKGKIKDLKESTKEYSSQAVYERKIIMYLFSNTLANKTTLTTSLKINQNKLDEYVKFLIEKKLVKITTISKGTLLLSLTGDGSEAAEAISKIINSKGPISRLSVFSDPEKKSSN